MNGAVKIDAKALFSSERNRGFALLAVIGAFMAMIGAFDTDGAAIEKRLVYWLSLMMFGGFAHTLLQPRVAGFDWAQGFWRKGAFLAFCMTLALTPVVWLISAFVFGAELSVRRLLELSPGVFVVNAALVALLGVMENRQSAARNLEAPQSTIPEAIRNKLPANQQNASLIALQAEDHYVRVHTSVADTLVRMKFRDAVDALDDSVGFQTHRSWWVSEAAIRGVLWRRGRATLQMENETEVPVSRTYAKTLAAQKRL